ncbi:MAG: hypothetical protein AAF441_14530 [Pseudomonadota bacterium]
MTALTGLIGYFCVYSVLNWHDERPSVILLLFSALLALGGLANLLAHFTEEFVITEDGITYRSLLSGSGQMHWSSVERVTNTMLGNLRFELSDGRRIRVSNYMTSLPELAKAVFDHVSLNRITRNGIKFLREAQRGVLPVP